jgi:sigma-B regulation protein RsbU (phosphoserine phosphatase)
MDHVEEKLQLEVSTEVLATLVEISEKINASLDLDDVLASAADLTKRLIQYEIFAVLLFDRQQQLYFRFSLGYPPNAVEHLRIPLGQGITGSAAAAGEPIRVPDVGQDPRYINAHPEVRSELAVPMMVKRRCIGVLDIQSRQLDYFTGDQQNILSLLASRLAIAIENARLFEYTRQQAETLLLLNEIGREASSILDVEELLRRAAELVKRIIDYHIFSILLYDERDNVFRQRVNVKFGEKIQEKFAVPATEGIVGAAAQLRRAVLVPDVRADPRYIDVNPETRSELAVPMIHQNRVIGVLDLESPQPAYFTEDHVEGLTILASNLAVSLENARLYEKVARQESRMERDLNAARRIQGALLTTLPTEDYGLEIAARYDPARELGGDLYDFLRYGPQHLGVALGDVSGKGTAAALYGAVAIGILRSLAPQKLQPAEMLRRLNQLISERKIEGRFMTMCFATWQRNRRKLRMANAGQSQPLMWRAGRCEKVRLVGYPLGIFDEAEYEEWSTTLDPGDVLVFYSDGVVESANPEDEFFGADRLQALICANASLSATELLGRITAEVAAFSRGRAPGDDRTLVVLKATAQPAPDEKGE